ncbi:MAG: ATP-dependent helicase [Oscillochloris sp.]|nr:ATP-dependent helicase [Oscillochloris sp.]
MSQQILHADEWNPVGVDELEPNAELAVRSTASRLVVAGPGAGKTELLAQRASFLLQTATCPSPKRILAISFKRDAAKNLDRRVRERCGDRANCFDSLTLDAFGKRLVDQFWPALPESWRPMPTYQVLTTSISADEAEQWLMTAPVPTGFSRAAIEGWGREEVRTVFDAVMHGYELPYTSVDPQVMRMWGLHWWREQLRSSDETSRLTFPMLNRLAAYLLRCNPKIVAALRLTYSHVFLDEFQDTTASHWDLVRSAFLESNTVLTAVGDSKQRIMVWAGAKTDVFETFQKEFAAERVDLVRNYRSVPELVRIQHVIAQIVEAGTAEPVAASTRGGAGICSILEFRNPEQEAAYLANLIAEEIDAGEATPRDFCILTRQRTGEMVRLLQETLHRKGIALRDESALQELRAEPITSIVLSALRLATCTRDGQAWDSLVEEIAFLSGLDDESDGAELQRLVIAHKNSVAKHLAECGNLHDLPRGVVDVLGAGRYQATYKQYADNNFLNKVLSDLGKTLQASLTSVGDVQQVVDDVIGANIVPAMTIHKSKGLEFSTVIFLGLEDSEWWGFRTQPEEEKRAFFVAFSRAIHRVMFTFSDERDTKKGRRRQRRRDVDELHYILRQAGVSVDDKRLEITSRQV